MAQLDPPVPILAQWFVFPTVHLIVTFQHPLEPGPLDPANWTADQALNTYVGTAAVAAGAQVTVQMAPTGIGNLPNRCSYAATPPDVRVTPRVVADPFVDYPIT